jgi:hypothetical protein
MARFQNEDRRRLSKTFICEVLRANCADAVRKNCADTVRALCGRNGQLCGHCAEGMRRRRLRNRFFFCWLQPNCADKTRRILVNRVLIRGNRGNRGNRVLPLTRFTLSACLPAFRCSLLALRTQHLEKNSSERTNNRQAEGQADSVLRVSKTRPLSLVHSSSLSVSLFL